MNSEDAYREGYEKGRTDNLGGRLAEVTMGVLRDDPGGYYDAGYYDGAGGRKFNVHGSKDTTRRSPSTAPSLPSLLDSQWYRLCDESEFIPKETVDRCVAILHDAGCQVAAIIGLSPFTGHTCPRCGRSGHFRIHFLGRLRHPGACGWDGYMKTGSYIGHQIAQVFHTGIRAGGAMKDEADKKPDKRGNWIYAVIGFLFVAMFRAATAVVLIPLHCIAALLQAGQTTADIATRVITLAIIVTGIGIGVYEIRQASQAQSAVWPQVGESQTPAPLVATNGNTSGTYRPAVQPSFNCSKARTSVERLICRDSRLAALDVGMVSDYKQALTRLSPNAQLVLRREHLAWFKNYSRTCNQSTNENEQATCVANFLSSHAAELRNR
jgi:uncharacterized protein YecT (DUF1311 family)